MHVKFHLPDYKAFSYHMTVRLVQVKELSPFLLSLDRRLGMMPKDCYNCVLLLQINIYILVRDRNHLKETRKRRKAAKPALNANQ